MKAIGAMVFRCFIQVFVMAIQLAIPAFVAYDIYQTPSDPRSWVAGFVMFLIWHYRLDGFSSWDPKNIKRFLFQYQENKPSKQP